MSSTGHMTREERVAFLADVHVGILAIDEPGRGPLALPVWYEVDGDDVVISMDGSSLKARLLAAAGRATLTAQTEAPPYQYVSVEGPITIGPHPAADDGYALAARYLGPDFGRMYADANPPTADTVEVRLRPEHWRTFDFAKLLV